MKRRIQLLVAFTLLLGVVLLAGCQTAPEQDSEPEEPGPFATENPDYPAVEPEAPEEVPDFTWDNATVYFAMIDRFHNTTPDEPNAYGRLNPDEVENDIGVFHGGDIAGLTERIEDGYFNDLGIDALWISSPLEQIHGWSGGGNSGEFAHYSYHGYWHLDWTEIDENYGSEEDFAEFMEVAHENDLRVVFDIVMNHPGYNTVKDMVQYEFGEWADDPLPEDFTPDIDDGENWNAHQDHIVYEDESAEDGWDRWWGGDWARAGIAGYPESGSDDLTQTLEFLPDFLTESTEEVSLPQVLQTKRDMGESSVEEIPGATVREYLITWLTDWVREYGVDGFRVDTAKHVELDAWEELAEEATAALAEWKEENPEQAIDDEPFWMTGENFGQSVEKNAYFEHGFANMINFSFQRDLQTEVINDNDALDVLYQDYADVINSDAEFNVLSYLSSHDTRLWSNVVENDEDQHMRGLTRLFMAPGGIHLFYGDELMREQWDTPAESEQGTRSTMDWDERDNTVHEHAKQLGQFRQSNPAVGAGRHMPLESSSGYAFGRDYYGLNKVAVVMDAEEGNIELDTGDLFDDGTELYDAYNDQSATVEDGSVRFDAGTRGLLLIQEA